MRRRSLLVALFVSAVVSGCLGDNDGIDARGTVDIVIDGEPVDLTADRFQVEHADNASLDFHLHEGDEYWYMEGEERVTVASALDLLPHVSFTVIEGDPVMTVDGSRYDAGESATSITVRVDGDPVDPTMYQLRDGDHLEVGITTAAG